MAPVEHGGQPVFIVRFWGTRGSIAAPGMATARYGGNTSCTEVRCGDSILILDAGTGIRQLGQELLSNRPSQPIRTHIFLGHTHWDHIQGFPFFEPAYADGNEIFLYSAGKPLKRVLENMMNPDCFPVALSALRARISFLDLAKPISIGPVSVDFAGLNHPGGAVGFRLSAGGKAIVYLSDHEPFSLTLGEARGPSEDHRIESFVGKADLLICDAQYTEEEYAGRRGWGHSTFEYDLHLAEATGVRRLAFFHHNPLRSDDELDRIVDSCRGKARDGSLECFAAREGQTITIE